MSLIQFPENSILLAESSFAANAMTVLAELDDEYPSGLGIYIVNNSPFTTALVNIKLIPTQNINIGYSQLYNQSIYLEPQQALIITNPLNTANVEIQVTIDNTYNVAGYVIYNPDFETVDINGYVVLPLDALVQTSTSNTGSTSGVATTQNLQELQTYVSTEINNLQSTVSALSSIITDHFEELLDAVDFQTELNTLSASVETKVDDLSADVETLSGFVESTVPLITSFLENTVPLLSGAVNQLANQVLSNYQTFTDLNLAETARINALSAQEISDFSYLTSEISQVSSQLEENINLIASTLQASLDSSSSNLTSQIDGVSESLNQIEESLNSTIETVSSELETAINANTVSISNITQELSANVESIDKQLEAMSVNADSNINFQSQIYGIYNQIQQSNQSIGENTSNIYKVSSDAEHLTAGVEFISAGVDFISSVVDSITASFEDGTLNPQFASIQRNTNGVSQNWLPNSTFLYGLLKWNGPASGITASTISPCTSLLCTSNNAGLQYIESDSISPQWMDGSERMIALSLQMSNKVSSAPCTAEVLCYNNLGHVLGSVALLSLSSGEGNTYLSATDTLPEGTVSVVIRLGFNGAQENTEVSFSEIKFEYNNEPTLWSDEASSVIINDLYNKVYGAGSVTVN